jgi:alpha-glucosidase
MAAGEPGWWQRGVIYQIYPRSFQDTNGDGVGDLDGITRRLDYLRWLGIDGIWISPIFPSPMKDFGYDISDYTGIDPMFGTLADFDALLEAAHALDLKVILDFVPNHTSDRHPWFKEARRSRDNPYRDWYIWRDPARDGGPPNNWMSEFGGSAWALDAATGQYYYHAFLEEQPDLNWRNPAVVAAMDDALRFWFERGVDGMRIDALHHSIKDAQFRDNPPNPDWKPGMKPHLKVLRAHTVDQPEMQALVAGWRKVADAYGGRVLIGEINLPIPRLVRYYGAQRDGLQLPFNFGLMSTKWDAAAIGDLIARYEAALPEGAWPNWVTGNHDISRIATRIGSEAARLAAMLLLTLRGTPTLYYGDELGMTDVPIPPNQVQDPFEKRVPGIGAGRDPERTPMRWDSTPSVGFTTGTPWLPIGDRIEACNVESERNDPHSMLSLHRALLKLRRKRSALALGSYERVPAQDDCLVFIRRHDRERLLVALNFGAEPRTLAMPPDFANGRVLLSTAMDRGGTATETLALRPNEGVVLAPAR